VTLRRNGSGGIRCNCGWKILLSLVSYVSIENLLKMSVWVWLQISSVPEDLPGVQLLLHGRVSDCVPECPEGGESDPHPSSSCSLVWVLLLPNLAGRRIRWGLGLPESREA